MSTSRQDGIDAVIDLLTRLAAGEFEARGERTHEDEELDAIIFGINMLAEELSAHREELEERVRARTAELEVARKEATDASRMKSEFLATMSHEIRTPMNGVIGLTRLLGETNLVGVQEHYVDGLQRAGVALLTVINDVLDFSKLEAGKVVLEPVDFDPRLLLEKIASLMAMPASQKELELIAYCTPEVPHLIVGDDGRLGQILLNLTSNAVKFTEKGEVVLTARVSGGDDHVARLRFEVSDTGIGITPEAQRTLFDSFTQADASTTRRFGGSGLGLAISQRLCDVMGGSIGVDSEEGAGSTFWFELPLPVADSARPHRAGRDLLERQRVLIADDNRSSQLFLESQLIEWGMRAEIAVRAPDVPALMRAAAMEGDPYQVVLIDADLSEVDGWQLAHRIGADATLVDSRLLMLSRTLQLDAAGPSEPGVRELLCKPILASELFERLVGLLVVTSPRTSTRMASRAASVTSAPAAPRRGLVLVVEDNEVNQMVAEGLVEKLGYEVDVVSNGLEAVAAVAACRYSAVLMDCHMPVMDGYSATTQIREMDGGGNRTPIIAMTAGVTVEERQRCFTAGMDAYVAKPVDLDLLQAALRSWARADDEPTPAVEEDEPVALETERLTTLRQLRMSDGSPMLPALIEAFLAVAARAVATMRRTSQAGDAAALQDAAQDLDEAAVNVGAAAVADLARRVLRSGAHGELLMVPPLIDQLEAAIEVAGRRLREAVSPVGDC